MNTMRQLAALCLVGILVSGCGDDEFDLLGAWYGVGPNLPEKELCLIFCGNGQMTSDDDPCPKVKLTSMNPYTKAGNLISFGAATMEITENGEDYFLATITAKGKTYPNCGFNRVGSEGNFCN